MTTITLKGNPIQTIGTLPALGTQAPNFSATKLDLSEVSLKDFAGKQIVLNIFPSLDTATCALAMKKFNDIAATIPNLVVLCISADLPFAQKRFCAAENTQNVQPLSIFRHPEFGKNYGVLMTDGPLAGLLSRAVVLIDVEGKVIYTEQVGEITHEPNYDAVAKMLQK